MFRSQVINSYEYVNDKVVNDVLVCQDEKLGLGKQRFVSWGQAQTMIYLKISLSDFFTVFAARCRSW